MLGTMHGVGRVLITDSQSRRGLRGGRLYPAGSFARLGNAADRWRRPRGLNALRVCDRENTRVSLCIAATHGIHTAALGVHVEGQAAAALAEAIEQALGGHVLNETLHSPAQRARAVLCIVPLVDELLGERLREDQLDALLGRALEDLAKHQASDTRDVRARERVEDDDLIEPVEELGPEARGHLVLHDLFDAWRLRRGPVGPRGRTHGDLHPARRIVGSHTAPISTNRVEDRLAADVRGEDEHGVCEVDSAPLAISQPAILEHLQQCVEDVGVRLLDLVEENDGVRPATHRLRQLPALVKANVAGGRADQPRHSVCLHVLAHVEPDHRLLRAVVVLGHSLRELRLADARGAREDE
mmetsp:Transcript_12642/g.32981  ORF Transcript_12642/g.32981 Transcript_12642/m.32981 type:complete len:356 (+) Transcript_12642:48-1115(+)